MVDAAGLETLVPVVSPPKARRRWWRALLGNAKAVVGGSVLLLVIVAAHDALLFAPIDPNTQVLSDRLMEPLNVGRGDVFHLLGTDQLGRDVWSRILYGARVSLVVGVAAVALAGSIGITLGLLAGYHGGHVDDVVMRLADMQLALP